MDSDDPDEDTDEDTEEDSDDSEQKKYYDYISYTNDGPQHQYRHFSLLLFVV